MRALQIDRKIGRLGLARMLASMAPATAAKAGPVELVREDPPELPGPEWVRLRPRLAGICHRHAAGIRRESDIRDRGRYPRIEKGRCHVLPSQHAVNRRSRVKDYRRAIRGGLHHSRRQSATAGGLKGDV